MSQKHRTVLIVDDSPEDGELYRRYLQRDREYHYTFVQAELGREGLKLWQHHQPDIMLLDYRLPDLDGVEFLTQLQTWTRQLFLPVIVVTGQGNEAIAVQAIKAGAQDYLVKGQITCEGLQLAVNGAIENVQLRIQLQHELAERKHTEERLCVALEAAHMGTWDWNIQTNHIQWSTNLEALFGFAPGGFDGSYEMFVSSLHPDDRDRLLEAINSAVTTRADYNIEFRVVYPNGNIRWALSQGKVFYDQAGQPVRMSGVDLDITERKRKETELRENQQWLKLGQKATKSGLWDWDVTINKASISEEYCTLFGLDPATTVRLPLLNFEPEINQADDVLEQELDLTGIRVLTIDDEPDTRELLTVLLAQYGAEVMTVASSTEFLAALESFQPDVLVSDIGMPEVDGYTLLRQVRSLPPECGGQIGAIALTAYAGEMDQQKALAAGFQRHLAKPIEPHQLIQAVAVVYRSGE